MHLKQFVADVNQICLKVTNWISVSGFWLCICHCTLQTGTRTEFALITSRKTGPRRCQMNVVKAVVFLILLVYDNTQNLSYVKINVNVVFTLCSQIVLSTVEGFLNIGWQNWDYNSHSTSKSTPKSGDGPNISSVAFCRATWRQKYLKTATGGLTLWGTTK